MIISGKILRPGGVETDVSELSKGDVVVGWSERTGSFEEVSVVNLTRKAGRFHVILRFPDGGEIDADYVQLFWCVDKGGWVAYSPEDAYEAYRIEVGQLEVGDRLLGYYAKDGVEVFELEDHPNEESVFYEMDTSDGNDTFVCSGVVCHNYDRQWLFGSEGDSWNYLVTLSCASLDELGSDANNFDYSLDSFPGSPNGVCRHVDASGIEIYYKDRPEGVMALSVSRSGYCPVTTELNFDSSTEWTSEGDVHWIELPYDAPYVDPPTLVVKTVPSDAVVKFESETAGSITGNTYKGTCGGTVTYTVSREGYVTYVGTYSLKGSETVKVTLEAESRYTFTVDPRPLDAEVVLSSYGERQEGNSIEVEKGATVSWAVSAKGYQTSIGSASVTSSVTRSVVLSALARYVLSVSVYPYDATVKLSSEGETQSGNCMTVYGGATVDYEVSRTGYLTASGSVVVDGNMNRNVVLQSLPRHSVTVTCQNEGASVVLSSDGESQSGNSITVFEGSEVSYEVTLVGYDTVSGVWTVTEDMSEEISLEPSVYTLEVEALPEGTHVELYSPSFTQEAHSAELRHSIKAYYGDVVRCRASFQGYETYETSYLVRESCVKTVELVRTTYLVAVSPTPSDALVELSSTSLIPSDGNSIRCYYGAELSWKVSREGYDPQEGTLSVESSETLSVELVPHRHVVTVSQSPYEAAVQLSCEGETQVGNSIEADYGAEVSYLVTLEGHDSRSGRLTVTGDETVSVTLPVTRCSVSVNQYPSDATVTLQSEGEGTSVTGSITVDVGSVVSYSVEREGYFSREGTWTVLEDMSVDVSLTPERRTLAVSAVPSDATVSLVSAGETQVEGAITVDYGASVVCSVSRLGYAPYLQTYVMEESLSKVVVLAPLRYRVSVTASPSDATVVLSSAGETQEGNSITVNYGATVSCSVTKKGYYGQNVSYTVTSDADHVVAITLLPSEHVFAILPDPVDALVEIEAEDGSRQCGNSVTVPYGESVSWRVSREGYLSEDDSLVLTSDMVSGVTLQKERAVLSLVRTPSDASVTLVSEGGEEPEGNSVDVPVGTRVSYRVERDGYVPKTGTVKVTGNRVLNVSLKKLDEDRRELPGYGLYVGEEKMMVFAK